MRTNLKKRIMIVAVAVLVVVMAFAYILPPLAAFGAEYGTDDPSIIPPLDGVVDPVTQPTPEPDPPQLRILDAAVNLDVGQTYTFTCEMKNFPEGTMLEWRSDNPQVAAIGGDGKLIAIMAGVTGIEARAGDIRSTVLVTVNAPVAKSVLIVVSDKVANTGDKNYEVKVGDVVKFSAQIAPEGAKVEKITWVLGNDDVASLAQNGEFVAEKKGRTQVTVLAGALSYSITINIVENSVPFEQVKVYIRYIIIAVIVIVVILVIMYIYQKKRKEDARRKAVAAKRRKEEAERRAREEAEVQELKRQVQELRPQQTEDRATMKVSGAAVGAGADAPRAHGADEPERPVTLDDLE